jgi:hypothetical protein
MAIKTFTANSVLTAADTNTYLANSGLVYVKSQTVGTGVSSVNVTSAFSSTYDNYLITYQGGTMSVDTALKFKLGSNTNNCFGAFNHTPNYLLTTVQNVGDNSTAFFTYAGGGNSNSASSYLYVTGPNTATRTYINSGIVNYSTVFGTYVGVNFNTTQFTDFTYEPFSGTMTSGTITVYGFRKA